MSSDKQRLEYLELQLKGLESAYRLYLDITEECYKLKRKFKTNECHESLLRLTKETGFVDCSHPDDPGSANFETEVQARELTNALSHLGTFYNEYRLYWSGPGKYMVYPTEEINPDDEKTYYIHQFVKA